MRQSMGYEQQEHPEGEKLQPNKQGWSSYGHQNRTNQREKVIELHLKVGKRFLAASISIIVWCLSTLITVVAIGVANVSLSPSASITQVALVIMWTLFTSFIIWANVLLAKLLSK